MPIPSELTMANEVFEAAQNSALNQYLTQDSAS